MLVGLCGDASGFLGRSEVTQNVPRSRFFLSGWLVIFRGKYLSYLMRLPQLVLLHFGQQCSDPEFQPREKELTSQNPRRDLNFENKIRIWISFHKRDEPCYSKLVATIPEISDFISGSDSEIVAAASLLSDLWKGTNKILWSHDFYIFFKIRSISIK